MYIKVNLIHIDGIGACICVKITLVHNILALRFGSCFSFAWMVAFAIAYMLA